MPFPFTAVIGQEDVKEALILALINPQIGGVLIDGDSGTAKSTLARGVRTLTDMTFCELPANVSEDRLVGTIDLEKTIRYGTNILEPGLLHEANEGILYADGAALLSENMTDILIQVLSSGQNRIERDGISFAEDCQFLLIGCMNSKSEYLRKSMSDYFGLYARAESILSPRQRLEIVQTRDAYDRNPGLFERSYAIRTEELQDLIANARNLLKEIELTDHDLSTIVEKTSEACVEGHRADIVMYHTVRAVAAFHERNYVISEDIDEAAYFVLPHRRKNPPPQQQEPEEQEEQQEDHPEEDNDPQEDPQDQEQQNDEQQSADDHEQKSSSKSKFKNIPKAFAVGDPFQVVQFAHRKDRVIRNGNGKRTQTKTEARSGRYVFPTMQRRNDDLALDATIRAAAPYQRMRKKDGVAITIQNEDIREKVRQKRVSNLLVFVVDASGSMGVMQRMVETKGAILSLLRDAYVKRDTVAMVTFRGEEGQVVLPPTRSAERGYRLLKDIQTGGKTPLNAGIQKGLQVIQSQLRQHPDLMPMMIILTDGKGNVSIDSRKKPMQELIEIGEKTSKIKQIETMVIDIERGGLLQFGIAKRLADAMHARYYKLDQLKSGTIVELVTKERQKR